MRVAIEQRGRVVELKFYQNLVTVNRNGGAYDFDRRSKMPYLIRLRYDHTVLSLQRMLTELDVTLNREPMPLRGRAYIEQRRAEWVKSHGPKMYGQPIPAYNAGSADGVSLSDGQAVWVRGRDGRLRHGEAWHCANNMWMVLVAGGVVEHMASFELYASRPLTPMKGRWFEPARVRARLVDAKAKAIASEQFERAAAIRDALAAHSKEPMYLIWSNEHQLYWRPEARGYTRERQKAGLFTAKECGRERHPTLRLIPVGTPEAAAA
ncbi:UvrB/UvrC motif-containing protein [Rhodanobacter glycinis]|uniref:UvrB/UvrC motif-containing protein n=1 Tax=Rhodanobacter glycinis TaxID=582702 RepID=UPI0013759F18|nr:UvrB/UvrC motif-containing protein [Rhodanobacter glycinis]